MHLVCRERSIEYSHRFVVFNNYLGKVWYIKITGSGADHYPGFSLVLTVSLSTSAAIILKDYH